MNDSYHKYFPLSSQQNRIWFLSQYDPLNPMWNIFYCRRFKGNLDLKNLQKSLQFIIEHHSILRTIFKLYKNIPYQIVTNADKIKNWFKVINLTEYSNSYKTVLIKKLLKKESRMLFDLFQGPLFRFTVIKLSKLEYIFAINFHNIIGDGYSLKFIWIEIAHIYNKLYINDPDFNVFTHNQYYDYIKWQQDFSKSESYKEQEKYWINKCKENISLLNLPYDYTKSLQKNFSGALISRIIDKNLKKKLNKLSISNKTLISVIFLTAFYILLRRYCNQKDFVIGTFFSGRTHNNDWRNIFGVFVNTLPFYFSIPNKISIQELLSYIQKEIINTHKNQDYPIERIIQYIKSIKKVNYSSIFNVTYNYIDYSLNDSIFSQLSEIKQKRVDLKISQYDLTLHIINHSEKVELLFEYNTNLFKDDTIKKMVEHYTKIIYSISNNLDISLTDAKMLTKSEVQNLLRHNNFKNNFITKTPVNKLFEQQVTEYPDNIAVVYKNNCISYQELNKRSNQLASYLISNGVGPNVLVGISLEKSIDMIISILGVFKAGGAYLPLDPDYPDDRLRYMVKDADLSILLTNTKHKKKYVSYNLNIIDLTEQWNKILKCNKFNLKKPINNSNLSYVLYTSGSTGVPKGVLIEHKGLANLAMVHIRDFNITTNSHILQFLSLSFDGSISEILMALCSGATLYLDNKYSLFPGPDLEKTLNKYCITHLTLTPCILELLCSKNLPNLRNIIIGGEPYSLDLVRKWLPGRKIFNVYGPTEDTVCTTLYKFSNNSKYVSIGKPIDNKETYILNNDLQLMPANFTGEIYIGGIGISRGYLNQPDITKEKFIPNMFNNNKSKLYRSGDAAKYLNDGNICYLKRLDKQVKIRGIRIELDEVKNVIESHTKVKTCIINCLPDILNNYQIVAYLVVNKSDTLSIKEISDYLKQNLPKYMIPSFFLFIDSIPLTIHGKIDYNSLPMPNLNQNHKKIANLLPENDIQIKIAKIWQEVLNIEKINIDENFFDLGGYSLQLTIIQGKLKKIFQNEISIIDLFENPSIRTLAEFINQKKDYNDIYIDSTRLKEKESAINNYRIIREKTKKSMKKLQI